MKKLTTLLTLMAGIGFALGQGSVVNFNNNGVPGIDHKVYFDANGQLPGVTGTNIQAELYYVDTTAGNALTPFAASISKFRVTSTVSPGTWSGKTVTLPIGGLNVPMQLEVVCWDSTLGGSVAPGVGTYAQAKALGNVYSGNSGLFAFMQVLTAPPATTDTQMVNMPAFAITTVPEPSAIALSVIGVAGLLFLRRRK